MPRLLVVCAGNTCRSPTLALLLRHRLRQLGMLGVYVVDSAGIETSACRRRPMPIEAQKALASVADALDHTCTVVATYDPLRARAALRDEAGAYRSHHILELDTSPPVTHVYSVLSAGRMSAAPHPFEAASFDHHLVRDSGFKAKQRHPGQPHLWLKKYAKQTDFVARVVLPLCEDFFLRG